MNRNLKTLVQSRIRHGMCFTLLIFASLFPGTREAVCQVAINTDNSVPDNSAMLDIKSAGKGLLVPRMTTAERNSINLPATGLLVFCTDNAEFYCNKGTPVAVNWVMVSSQWMSNGSDLYYSTGNVGIGSLPNLKLQVYGQIGADYGTTTTPSYTFSSGNEGTGLSSPDISTLSFITAGAERARINDVGTVGIGTSSPNNSAILDISSTSRGVLIPRMTSTQRLAMYALPEGLLVYQTDAPEGFYYYSGTKWIGLADLGSNSGCIDYDGNAYPTVMIGTQQWMAENLRVLHYRNGEAITNVTDNTAWSNLLTGAYCWYNNDATNYSKYGALYNWYAVNDNRKLCPAGWHVSSVTDWTTLVTYLGGLAVAGGKMKSLAANWTSPNVDAVNTSGLGALPAGFRLYNGAFGSIGGLSSWFTSTESSTSTAYQRYILNTNGTLYSGSNFKETGMSVRCIRD